ncbi:MazG-like nucleotide pyrophosphohydrolase [Ruegeria phage RpAliso]|nr:MazG-like nucleotide pyrophosphohydrolase [Ruegeria phage RpAliso]
MAHEEFRQHGSFDKALAHLVEETGEVLAAAGKTLRFGRDSVNPYLPLEQQETNENWLKREVADLKLSIAKLEEEAGW